MIKSLLAVAVASLVSSAAVAAESYATAKEAEAMVAKAVKAVAADRAGAYKEITAKDKKWIDRDLYPVVYDMNGKSSRSSDRTSCCSLRVAVSWSFAT